jgi:hypothetical protein
MPPHAVVSQDGVAEAEDQRCARWQIDMLIGA